MKKNDHYFFAVKLSKEVKDFLYDWVEQNREDFPFARWVHKEDYHITLAFLGSAQSNQLTEATENIRRALSNNSQFHLTLHKIGTFGAPKSPRIFWADVLESSELNDLQQIVYEQCSAVGFQLDKKPFRPHITFARKWKGDQPFNPEHLKEIIDAQEDTVSFQVTEVVLYESHVDETPKYKEIDSIQLK